MESTNRIWRWLRGIALFAVYVTVLTGCWHFVSSLWAGEGIPFTFPAVVMDNRNWVIGILGVCFGGFVAYYWNDEDKGYRLLMRFVGAPGLVVALLAALVLSF